MTEEVKEPMLPGIDVKAKRARFDYIKSNHFRVIHVDGIYGGPGPRGNFHMSIWNERWPIPKQAVHDLKPDGVVGEEIHPERITRNAIVREVEVQLIMNIETAKTMHVWLGNKIASFEEFEKGEK